MIRSIARVALPIPRHEPFDYRIPEAIRDQIHPGVLVRVPFGATKRHGWVVELTDQSPHPKLRDVESKVPTGAEIPEDLLDLLRWTADYYLCGIGEVIESAVPRPVRDRRVRQVRWVQLTEDGKAHDPQEKEPLARRKILEQLQKSPRPIPFRSLIRICGTSESPVKTLEKRNLIEVFEALPPEFGTPGDENLDSSQQKTPPPFDPNPQQRQAIDKINSSLDAQQFKAFLLHGVTGSGKTEVYIRCVEKALEMGLGALVLLPEIALTPQAVERFTERLGPVAILHSMLPDTERAVHYERLRRGEVRIALGARSAVFAPVPELGIIVVDECHESSYKQENTPRYHARDVAVMRAHRLGIPCILGSATPSMESLENVRRGRFERLRLDSRVNGRPLARIEVVDRRSESGNTGGLLSHRLIERIRATLGREEQVLLFLNRRGFARNLQCNRCGFSLRCEQCDIPLTYHKQKDHSQCHYCGEKQAISNRCPQCKVTGLRQQLPGTERIEETLIQLFPETEIDRLDRDTATSTGRMEAILRRFREGKTQILIGTQMIAKGHDIPGVTLVGVLDADIALGLPDFRSAERTAQLLCQVAGRAGRGDQPGQVVLQTRQPEHYALGCASRQDLDQLLTEEDSIRKLLKYPPHGHLARLLCEDETERRALETAQGLVEAMKEKNQGAVQILGPAPAPFQRLRGRFRIHVLIKCRDRGPIREVARMALDTKPRWASTRVSLDIDPQNLL
ncbi:MAG: primosomal protein N' [Planctomycetota bacterium]|nr:primosomal protein N' [Planctomycetota bacterium]